MKEPTEKQIEKASHLTHKELAFINAFTHEVMDKEFRPIVYIALCSSILGNIIRGGPITKKTVMNLVDITIQL